MVSLMERTDEQRQGREYVKRWHNKDALMRCLILVESTSEHYFTSELRAKLT